MAELLSHECPASSEVIARASLSESLEAGFSRVSSLNPCHERLEAGFSRVSSLKRRACEAQHESLPTCYILPSTRQKTNPKKQGSWKSWLLFCTLHFRDELLWNTPFAKACHESAAPSRSTPSERKGLMQCGALGAVCSRVSPGAAECKPQKSQYFQ